MVFEPITNTLNNAGGAEPRNRAQKHPDERKELQENKEALWADIKAHRDLLFNGAKNIADKHKK